MTLASPAPIGEWTYSFNRFPSALYNAFVPISASLCGAVILIGWSATSTTTIHVLATVIAVLFVIATFARARRIGIWASRTDVVGKGFFRTHEFQWADVEELRVAQAQGYRAWRFTMRDGRAISVQCLPARYVFSETQRLAATSATPVKVLAKGTKPDDF